MGIAQSQPEAVTEHLGKSTASTGSAGGSNSPNLTEGLAATREGSLPGNPSFWSIWQALILGIGKQIFL